jgi:hypothetical protein
MTSSVPNHRIDDRSTWARPARRHRVAVVAVAATLMLLVALPAAVRAGSSPLADAAVGRHAAARSSVAAAEAALMPTTDPYRLPGAAAEPARPGGGSVSSLLLLALITATLFIVAVAYDSRGRDDDRW